MKLLMFLVTTSNESPDHPESMDEILGTIFFIDTNAKLDHMNYHF
jgi:hypothetical protein